MDVHIRQCNEQSTPPLFVHTNPSSQLQSASKPFHIQNVFPPKNNNRGRWELQFSVRTDNIKKKINIRASPYYTNVCLDIQSVYRPATQTAWQLMDFSFEGQAQVVGIPSPSQKTPLRFLAVLAHLLIDLFSCLSYSFYHNSQIINL